MTDPSSSAVHPRVRPSSDDPSVSPTSVDPSVSPSSVDPGADRDGVLVVLAPHYDDGVFSVGGVVHRHARTGGTAIVVTVFGGPPESEADAGSPLALALHERWARASGSGVGSVASPTPPQIAGTGGARVRDDSPAGEPGEALTARAPGALAAARAIVELRRREDATALTALGAQQHTLDFPDCIYRRVGTRWRCESDTDLFASDGPDEPALREAIARALEPFAEAGLVLAPLGLGRHVDHALVHLAARDLPNVGYYEDFPYALRPAGWARRYVVGLEPIGWPIELADLHAKERACEAYASQWPTFWADVATLSSDLRRGSRSGWPAGVLCETVWLPPDSTLRDGRSLRQGHPHR